MKTEMQLKAPEKASKDYFVKYMDKVTKAQCEL